MAESRKSGIASSFQEHPRPPLQGGEVLLRLASQKTVQKIYKSLGKDASLHLVGGTVRDALLGVEGADLDLASAMSAEEMLAHLEKDGFRVIPTGLKHGTITCAVEGRNIEITTFRAGRGKHAGLIEEDLAGRDFTINAIAFSIGKKELIDPCDGQKDLFENLLRFVGTPQDRIIEDPLRMLRLVRFGYAAGRRVEDRSSRAVHDHHALLRSVSVERIRVELEKILLEPNAAEGFRALFKLELLQYVLPELLPTIGFEQNEFHTADVFEHTLEVITQSPKDKVIRLAALYHDIGKAHTLSVGPDGKRHFYDHEKVSTEIADTSMRKLRFSNEDVEAVKTIVRLHMRPFDCGPAGVRRILRDTGTLYPLWREFKNADRPAVFDDNLLQELKDRFDTMVEIERSRSKGSVFGKLAISGDDLIALGMKPGKELGSILKEIQTMVLDNPDFNDRDVLLEKAKTLCLQKKS